METPWPSKCVWLIAISVVDASSSFIELVLLIYRTRAKLTLYNMSLNPLHWFKCFRSTKPTTMAASQTASPVPQLRALSDLIKASVDRIEALCAELNQTYPLLELPITPQSEAARMSPDVIAEGTLIVAAAGQLIATVRPPLLGMPAQAVQVRHPSFPCVAPIDTAIVSCIFVHASGHSPSRARNSERCGVPGMSKVCNSCNRTNRQTFSRACMLRK